EDSHLVRHEVVDRSCDPHAAERCHQLSRLIDGLRTVVVRASRARCPGCPSSAHHGRAHLTQGTGDPSARPPGRARDHRDLPAQRLRVRLPGHQWDILAPRWRVARPATPSARAGRRRSRTSAAKSTDSAIGGISLPTERRARTTGFRRRRAHRAARRACLTVGGSGGTQPTLSAGALAVLAPWPATGPTLAFPELLLGPANAALSGHLPLGILDPADELVAGQRRDVLPGIESRGVGDQRLAQVSWKPVHHPTGYARAAHSATLVDASTKGGSCPIVPVPGATDM